MTTVLNPQVSQTERSPSLHSSKNLPPLPLTTPCPEPLYQNPDLSESSHQVQEMNQKSQVNHIERSRFDHYSHKPLPPLPRPLSDPEPLYEDVDFSGSDHSEEEDDWKSQGSRKVPRPPLPPPPRRKPPPIPSSSVSESTHEQHSEYLEILPSQETMVREPAVNEKSQHGSSCKPPPLLPRELSHSEPQHPNLRRSQGNRDSRDTEDGEEMDELMKWWNAVEPWEEPPLDFGFSEQDETKTFRFKAHRIQKGIRFFDRLLSKSVGTLSIHIAELNGIANTLDQVHKKTKILGIAGSTTGMVAGVSTVVAGITLAPLTMGASLVATAVGAGMIAAGGLTGASAAINKKVNSRNYKKKVEGIAQDYRAEILEIERSLAFIGRGVEHLRKWGEARPRCADPEDTRPARAVELAESHSSSILTAGRSSEILQNFSLGLESCFIQKDSQKLKKGSESKFAGKVRKLAQSLQEALNDLSRLQEVLSAVAF